jgi:hypothetical protein
MAYARVLMLSQPGVSGLEFTSPTTTSGSGEVSRKAASSVACAILIGPSGPSNASKWVFTKRNRTPPRMATSTLE